MFGFKKKITKMEVECIIRDKKTFKELAKVTYYCKDIYEPKFMEDFLKDQKFYDDNDKTLLINKVTKK